MSERWKDPRIDCMKLLSAASALVSNSVHEETSHVLRRYTLTLDRRRVIWTWGSGTLPQIDVFGPEITHPTAIKVFFFLTFFNFLTFFYICAN